MTNVIPSLPTDRNWRNTALAVLAVCTVMNLMARGVGETFAVFLLPLGSEFGWARAELTGVYSLAMITHGRHPTLGEVREYYAREDFLEFLRRTRAVRKVVMVVPPRKHWEPQWETRSVPDADIAALRRLVSAPPGDGAGCRS